jgi:hypothetical protein
MSRRAPDTGGAIVVPAAVATAGAGLLADKAPVLAAGLGAGVLLILMPLGILLAMLLITAIVQTPNNALLGAFRLAGLHVRLAEVIVFPLAVRAYLFTRPELKYKWGAPEFLLLGWFATQLVSTATSGLSFVRAVPSLALLGLGVVAYFTIFRAVVTQRRLLQVVRVFTGAIVVNAAYGVIALAMHLAAGTQFGISRSSSFGIGVNGFSFEHDIFGSTCAAGAIIFYALWREGGEIWSRRFCVVSFWTCFVGMFLGLARAAWLGFALAFVMLIVLTARRPRRRIRVERLGGPLIGLTLIAVAAVWVFAQTPASDNPDQHNPIGGIKTKIQLLFNTTQGTGKGRLHELNLAVGDVLERPLLGWGTSSFDQLHPLSSTSIKNSNYIGNLWLRTLHDSGVLGFVLFLGVFALVLRPNRVLLRAAGETGSIIRALTFGWIVLMVAYAGTDDTLFLWPWIFLALVRVARIIAAREHQRVQREAAHGPNGWGSRMATPPAPRHLAGLPPVGSPFG